MKPIQLKEETHKTVRRSALWRNRAFMLLWSGQSASSSGTAITQTAYPLLVWDISHSAALVGLVGGISTLPYLFLSLIVGALIDTASFRPWIAYGDPDFHQSTCDQCWPHKAGRTAS